MFVDLKNSIDESAIAIISTVIKAKLVIDAFLCLFCSLCYSWLNLTVNFIKNVKAIFEIAATVMCSKND